MDDELPLIIFVVSHLHDSVNIVSRLNLIKDYMNNKVDLDFEEQVLANTEVAVNYITNEWNLEQKSN